MSMLLRGLIVGLLVALLSLFGLMRGLERWGLNTLFAVRGPIPPTTPIVVVSIDEDSFDELDLAWPWPRAMHGKFLNILSLGRPAAVGFDLVFAEPSSRGPEDDQAFAAAIRRAGNVVLASAMTVIQEQDYVKEDMNAPIPPLRKNAVGYGFANFETDEDAFVRRTELKRRYQDQDAPNFDLEMYRTATKAGVTSAPIETERFLINFRGGPKTFSTIPYYRILNGEVPPEALAGKIVLIGATSPILQDVHATPLSPQGTM